MLPFLLGFRDSWATHWPSAAQKPLLSGHSVTFTILVMLSSPPAFLSLPLTTTGFQHSQQPPTHFWLFPELLYPAVLPWYTVLGPGLLHSPAHSLCKEHHLAGS